MFLAYSNPFPACLRYSRDTTFQTVPAASPRIDNPRLHASAAQYQSNKMFYIAHCALKYCRKNLILHTHTHQEKRSAMVQNNEPILQEYILKQKETLTPCANVRSSCQFLPLSMETKTTSGDSPILSPNSVRYTQSCKINTNNRRLASGLRGRERTTKGNKLYLSHYFIVK